MTSEKSSLYKQSGVDVSKGDALVNWLQETPQTSCTAGETVAGIGGFASLFRPDLKRYRDPLLVSATDGVGTKVLLGLQEGHLENLGIDLVAMCANDLFTIGADAAFFLDYYATGQLNSDQFKKILFGIKRGVAEARAVLIGGETAELPGLYAKGHFDLAGFLVGLVDGEKRLGPEKVKGPCHVYGLKSCGFHSNGFSLIRKWLNDKPQPHLLQKILAPTTIYTPILDVLRAMDFRGVSAMAHITGGGICGNLIRVLPENTLASLSQSALPTPRWMIDFITQYTDHVMDTEQVFNLGVGMMILVEKEAASEFEKASQENDLEPILLGETAEIKDKKRVEFCS